MSSDRRARAPPVDRAPIRSEAAHNGVLGRPQNAPTALCLAPELIGAWATGAGGRGWLPTARSPQSVNGSLPGLRWFGGHYLCYAARPSLVL